MTTALLQTRRLVKSGGGIPHFTLASLAIFAFLTLTILGPFMAHKPAPFSGEGSPLRQVCYFALLLFIVFAVDPIRRPRRLLAVPLTMIIALAWCWASLAWSAHPDIALRRLLLTTIVIWTVFLAVGETRYARAVAILRIVLVATLVGNYVAVILFPNFGIHQLSHDWDHMSSPDLAGAWRGIVLQKNFAGAVSAFTVLCFVLDGRAIRPWLRWGVVAAAAFFLFMTTSKTSMSITLFSLVLGGVYLRYNPAYRMLLIPVLMVAGAAVFLLLQIYWADLAKPLYDRSAFTGRTQIWPPLLNYFRDNPLLGAGYGSFWNIGIGESPIFTYAKGWVTGLAQGHNGYLDLLVTIGAPGLALAVLATVVAPTARLLASRTVPRGAGALLLAMLTFVAGHNFTESSLFDRDAIVQSFLMITLAMVHVVTAASPRPARARRPALRASASAAGAGA